ncbi:hypothetical protein [Trinickia fusca]|uniref:hypothetical protein n=1 Tax=Trinickia fusca TaxID=2419777 RepID=UPI00160167A5|nr:hypothetical protein [Trinickia fusca]
MKSTYWASFARATLFYLGLVPVFVQMPSSPELDDTVTAQLIDSLMTGTMIQQ